MGNKILIIDSDKATRAAVLNSIKQGNVQFVEHEHKDAAIEALTKQASDFAVIVTDSFSQDLIYIQNLLKFSIPTILLFKTEDQDVLVPALKLGIMDFIEKPLILEPSTEQKSDQIFSAIGGAFHFAQNLINIHKQIETELKDSDLPDDEKTMYSEAKKCILILNYKNKFFEKQVGFAA